MSLPEPPVSFRWRREVWGEALACVPLESLAQHVFTTRQLQLHADSSDGPWELVAASLGAKPDQVFRIRQVHGRAVRVVSQREVTTNGVADRPEADAIISNVPGIVLAVQVADCVPMLIVDTRSGAAAAVHAGWRGTAASIVRHTIESLRREFGTQPEHLVVAVGPSIGRCCYEVGSELIDAFRSAGANRAELDRWFSRTPCDVVEERDEAGRTLRLDLWLANQDQLVGAGVLPANIHVAGLCSQTHATIFDSYRVAGPRAGRMIAAIKVPHV